NSSAASRRDCAALGRGSFCGARAPRRSSVRRCSVSTQSARGSRRRRGCGPSSARRSNDSKGGRWPDMAKVRYDQATRIYPGTDVPAVDALSLEIEDGEFLVLVGPSGSGKTTALRMLAGLEEVDAGTISIGDRDVPDLPPKRRDVAMVFQNYEIGRASCRERG